MKIAVWHTSHEIADTVADAIHEGLNADIRYTSSRSDIQSIALYDAHVAYGVLRGCDVVFKDAARCRIPYFHLDRGYTNPGHFYGNYRISLNGTQQVRFWPDPIAHTIPLQPWRGFDENKPVLVCPPTGVVAEFFGIAGKLWPYPSKSVLRHKGDQSKINFQDYNYVHTFNSSLGWQAIASGIPCVSDPTFSMVGSFFKNISLASLSEKQYLDRERLFGTMSSLQMTLKNMRDGKIWPLLSNLLSMSASIAANPPPLTWRHTPSENAPVQNPQSNT